MMGLRDRVTTLENRMDGQNRRGPPSAMPVTGWDLDAVKDRVKRLEMAMPRRWPNYDSKIEDLTKRLDDLEKGVEQATKGMTQWNADQVDLYRVIDNNSAKKCVACGKPCFPHLDATIDGPLRCWAHIVCVAAEIEKKSKGDE